MVHRRQLNGQEIILGNQGDLWGNAMTWWDHDTGSIWSQPLGEVIAGPLKGETIELLPSTLTMWSAWAEAHPDTLALDAPAGLSGFDLSQMTIVVEFADDAVAYPVIFLRDAGVANDTVAGADIAVVVDPADDQRWAVFSRKLDDRTITLAVDGGRLVDIETGTVWDPVRGRGLDGPLEGEALDLLPAITSFPSDFMTFWPHGRFWEP